MGEKFGQMSEEEFCDWVSANPGSARKAFEYRKKNGGGQKEIRTVEVVREVVREVKVPVEKIKEVVRTVEVEKVIEKSSRLLIGSTVSFVVLFLLALMAYGGKEVNPVSYVDREVEVEVVREVVKVVDRPVEVVKEVIKEVRVEVPVIKEVIVSDEYTESRLRDAVALRDKEIDRLHRRAGDLSTHISRLRFGR